MIKEKILCEYCGKPAAVWFRYETLCDNCWKGTKLAEEDKKSRTPNKSKWNNQTKKNA